MDLEGKAIISENYVKPRQCIKKQRHSFAHKGPYSQSYGFSSSHVWMWELNHKEGWAPKNWCFWTVVLEKTLESPLEINPKGNQSWIFIGRTDVEAETPILSPPDAWSQFIRNDPDVGKDWRQKEKEMTEDKMVGWYQWLNRHEFEEDPGHGGGHGCLVCCRPYSHKESDMTELLNNKLWDKYNLTFTVTFNIHFNSITLLKIYSFFRLQA